MNIYNSISYTAHLFVSMKGMIIKLGFNELFYRYISVSPIIQLNTNDFTDFAYAINDSIIISDKL